MSKLLPPLALSLLFVGIACSGAAAGTSDARDNEVASDDQTAQAEHGATPAAPGPADIVYENAAVGDTTFSHTKHLAKQGSACKDCHPKPFAMKQGGTEITMATMNAGQNCGTCHDGGQAFATSACASCHKK